MEIRRVDAGRGIGWISEAVQLLQRDPQPFALMGLVLAMIGLLPVAGGLAMAVLGPAFYGGIMFAAQETQRGRRADFNQLFAAFQQPGKLPKMLLLCLPGVAAGLLLGMLAIMFLGGALLAVLASAAADSEALAGASLGSGGVLFFALALAIGLAAFAAVCFAIPRVMLDEQDPLQAIRDSLAASLANIGALATLLAVVFVAVVVANLLLAWISVALTQLVMATVLIPVFSVATLIATREIFPANANEAAPPPAVEL